MATEVKKPKKTKYAKGTNQGTILDNTVTSEIQNYLTDQFRKDANNVSATGRWLTGKKPEKHGAGDWIFGTGPVAKTSAPAPSSAPPIDNTPIPRIEQIQRSKSFADYLAEANAMSSGQSSGPDYGALISNLKGNAASGDARLAAMYSQLQNNYAADAPKIQANYDAAASQQGANSAEAQKQTAQGFENARAQQTAQLDTLGIGDAAAVLAANGGQAARDQSIAQSNIATNGVANQNQTTANKASALTYNTQIGQAAGAEGASQRATLQQNLAAKLAEIQAEQAQSAQSSFQNNVGLAGTLADWDNAAAQRRASQNDPTGELKNQLLAQQVLSAQLKNQNYSAATKDPTSQYAQLQSIAQQFGVDPANQDAMSAFIKSFQQAQSVKLQ